MEELSKKRGDGDVAGTTIRLRGRDESRPYKPVEEWKAGEGVAGTTIRLRKYGRD